MTCPGCGSSAVKNGVSQLGMQMYRCRSCRRKFADSKLSYVHVTPASLEKIVVGFHAGTAASHVAAEIGVHEQMVQRAYRSLREGKQLVPTRKFREAASCAVLRSDTAWRDPWLIELDRLITEGRGDEPTPEGVAIRERLLKWWEAR